jgi:hypothetical protein
MLLEEIELLKNIASDVLDIPVEEINVKGKTAEQVLARLVVCNILMQGGITPTTLSRHFCKHRTNFYHYKKLHKHYTLYPKAYPEYNEAYILVVNRFEDESNVGSLKRNLQTASTLEEIDLAIANLKHFKNQLV